MFLTACRAVGVWLHDSAFSPDLWMKRSTNKIPRTPSLHEGKPWVTLATTHFTWSLKSQVVWNPWFSHIFKWVKTISGVAEKANKCNKQLCLPWRGFSLASFFLVHVNEHDLHHQRPQHARTEKKFVAEISRILVKDIAERIISEKCTFLEPVRPHL